MAEIHYDSHAKVTTRPDGRAYLVTTITIDCPACGQVSMVLPGHHLRAVRDLLIKFIDAFPDFTGKDSEVKVLAEIYGEPPLRLQ